MDLNAFLDDLKLAVRQAGAVAHILRFHVRDIGKSADVPAGSENDAAGKAAREAKSAVDMAIQDLILTLLVERYPQIAFTELASARGGAHRRARWIGQDYPQKGHHSSDYIIGQHNSSGGQK